MSKQTNRTKETFDYERRRVLLLKEAFDRDLKLFYELVKDTPRSWTFTVISEDNKKSLVVNIPSS